MPCNIDHSVIGLIDPANVTFVHQIMVLALKKIPKNKRKIF